MTRTAQSGEQLVHLYSPDGSHWNTQIVATAPLTPVNLVTTSYRGSVHAYWTELRGRVWRSLLTPDGFSPPTELRWAADTRVLQSTYYMHPGTSAPEPVLYGLSTDRHSAGTGLWVRTLHGRPDRYILPGHYALTEHDRATGIKLSMTGRRSWVLDTTHNGFLRRWDGTAGCAVSGGLTYIMAQVPASRVIGTCSPAHLHCPTPLFLSDGRLYLWHPQLGPVPCTTISDRVTDAAAVERTDGQSLVFLSNADGRLSVTRQLSVQPLDPKWGYSRIIARDLPAAGRQLVALTHPNQVPALFTVGTDEISLFVPSAILPGRPYSEVRTSWTRKVVPAGALVASGLITPHVA
ncbi:hypothetical protein ACIBEA_43495 [Streptomyces sp. NPDC051555]|uniref:hypothetical protein n=1 Tax=Streptomyces sp. NPDC051555 TaxID=3365657 RepID=UPI003794441D